MTAFIVFKGVDAFVNYSTSLEADSIEQANALAQSRDYAGEWVETGVHEYDSTEIFEDQTREFTAEDLAFVAEVDDMTGWALTVKERDQILAALTMWRDSNAFQREKYHDIVTNAGLHENPMTDDEVNVMIEEFNE